jgi:murein L,D-transpeptidase YcbB/YkuD
VLINYATAVAEEDGEVFFYHDLYGHDARAEKALAKGSVPAVTCSRFPNNC